jgi:hypothetical protein
VQKTKEVVHHLAARGYGPGDVSSGSSGVGEKTVQSLGDGTQVASAA